MAYPVIETRAVVKNFGEVRAVDGVDLAVNEGEIFGLIGHNGAGKSTLFRMMLGLIPASAGDIVVAGEAVRGPAFREVRRRIGYLPENVVFYDNLTALETLSFFARLKSAPLTQCAELLAQVGLAEAAERRVRGFSKGMRQRLGFAQALLGSPALLFLDEPTNGLDPEGIREFYAILNEMRGRGVTVIISSHILTEIQERVDRLAIMKSGRLHALGTVQDLREKMGLPLCVRVRLAEGAIDALRATLAALGFAAPVAANEAWRFTAPRERKLVVMHALSSLPGVIDLSVHEPSLEDVFMGYAA